MSTMDSRAAEQKHRTASDQPPNDNTTVDVQSPIGQIMLAGAGDHPAVLRFLQHTFRAPPSTDFNNQLEEPFYEPTDRLVVRHDSMIIGHSRLISRVSRFGSEQVPISCLTELGVTAEFRHLGVGSALLMAAEQQMQQVGSMAGMLRTTIPAFYARHGWILCTSPSRTTATAHEILSHLISQQAMQEEERLVNPLNEPLPRLNIRLWRHVEQDALMRIYQENTVGCFGAFVRSEDYWRWAFNRRAFDRIYVAIDGTEKIPLGKSLLSIVGYAAVKGGRLVEVMVDAGREDARLQLLQRVCSDSVEREHLYVNVDAPADDEIHRILYAAGGKSLPAAGNGQTATMLKLFDPLQLAQLVRNRLRQNVRDSDTPFPLELGLELPQQRMQIICNRRSTRFLPGKLGRSYLKLTPRVLSQLLLGQYDVRQAVQDGAVIPSTHVAVNSAEALFPSLPLWLPPLDDLSA